MLTSFFFYFEDTIVKIDHQPNQHYLKVFLWLFWEAKTWDNFLFTQVYWKLDLIYLLFALCIQRVVWTSDIWPLPTQSGDSRGLAWGPRGYTLFSWAKLLSVYLVASSVCPSANLFCGSFPWSLWYWVSCSFFLLPSFSSRSCSHCKSQLLIFLKSLLSDHLSPFCHISCESTSSLFLLSLP